MALNLFSNYLNLPPIPLVGSHRGISLNSIKNQENTLTTIFSKENIKADYCEVDLLITKDLQLILFHDDQLSNSPIEFLDYSMVIKLNPDIITLDTLLTHIAYMSDPPLLNIELKSYFLNFEEKKKFISKLISTIKTYTLNDSLLISSFDMDLLKLFRKNCSDFKIALLLNPEDSIRKDNNFINKLDALCPHIDMLEQVKPFNLPNFVWEKSNESKIETTLRNFNSKQEIKQWIKQYNIFGLTTNNVQEVLHQSRTAHQET